jgi:transcription elongation factor GreA
MQEIKDKLKAELKGLERELRVELPREIRTAVAMGDLSENAEYKAALERQAYVKARIAQLRDRLASLATTSMQQIPTDAVGLGSTVTLLDLDTDEELTYELVFPEVADSDNGMLSIASPIGRSLMGHREGDTVKVKIPSGSRKFEVLELRTLHGKQPS